MITFKNKPHQTIGLRLTLFISIYLLCINHTKVLAEIRLPPIISNHMVLQQNSKVKLWGWCAPAEKINIKTGWDTVSYQTTGTGNAKWSILVNTPKPGGPYTIEINGSNKIWLEDILIGEVWLCSGQSNMGMSVNEAFHKKEGEHFAANDNIRFFQVTQNAADYPQDNIEGKWIKCTTESILNFSAVAYYFGKTLAGKLKRPVGLIHASWGGTAAETWTPADLVNKSPALSKAANTIAPSNHWPVKPGAAFNAMIYPLSNFTIAGTIWYQGENNTFYPSTYKQLFSALIKAWRKTWQKNFPFYYVQIAPYAYKTFNGAPLIREAQTQCLSLPKTGMVLTSDLVDDTFNVHPPKKEEVGMRLANYALAETYSITGLIYKSPFYKNRRIEKDKIQVYFENAESGLEFKNGRSGEFYIAGDDKIFYPATALIKDSSVVVYSDRVKKPVAVRYGFRNAALASLFNKEGLPVNFFRTDQW